VTSGRKRLLASVLVASAVAGCGSASSSPSTTLPTPGPSTTGSTSQSPTQGSTGSSALAREASSIREALQSGVDAHVFPGAVVVLRRGGQSRTVAVGRADVAGDVPMSPADRFRMASVVMAVNATINVAVNDYVVTVLNQALCDRADPLR
jgi:CubicO group peptidase (beta-lactamase class C family)